MKNNWPWGGNILLLLSILIAASCAIIYQLLIGSTASLFLGNSVEQFSLTIGLFLFFMGIGSWLSKFITNSLLYKFVLVEIFLGLLGGSAVGILYALFGYTDQFRYGMFLLISAIGTLIGLEIPLLTRFLRNQNSLRKTIANVLSMDYSGALIAALLFPYIILPFLGAMKASIVTGLINLIISIAIIIVFRLYFIKFHLIKLLSLSLISSVYLLTLLLFSNKLVNKWESNFYTDPISYQSQTKYQKITLTNGGERFRLYLDGHLQFDSTDEYRYHESLVHPAMQINQKRSRVMIIGGGDGLTAREVLRHPSVKSIDIVDIDKDMTELAKNNVYLKYFNNKALLSDKVSINNDDGFNFIRNLKQKYDIVILDLPDPREESLTKLYSLEAYKMINSILDDNGVVVTQATSPFYAPNAYWCIGKTLEYAKFTVISYHVNIPSFGDWGFHLGLKNSEAIETLSLSFLDELRFLNRNTWETMKVFPKDLRKLDVKINRLDKPLLANYYRGDWNSWF